MISILISKSIKPSDDKIRNLVDKQRDIFNSYAKIDREDMDALKRLGRMAAEGIIKDDDSVRK